MTDINIGTISVETANSAFDALAELLEPHQHIVNNADSYTKDEVVRSLGELVEIFEGIFAITGAAMEMALLTDSPVTDFSTVED